MNEERRRPCEKAEAAVEAFRLEMEMAAEEAELNRAGSTSARETERLKQQLLVSVWVCVCFFGGRLGGEEKPSHVL